ncbi:hypothetical protein VTN77DRAFT_1111 [Rasamsonia byssochlamydoides]|uniref:uncharacterized protein n=1 Tax=Rasamsonia byssochlamydoides TaxID=89139 RepID=UPI003744908F
MSMDSTDEPSKWVCRLECFFQHDNIYYGTGFVVNIPGSQKLSIMTAAHNILHVDAGHVRSIRVTFPNRLTVDVEPDECFVSSVYREKPTNKSTDESSISDYGLITIDQDRFDSGLHPGGCAFSVWRTDYDLLQKPVTVHGYLQGKPDQAKGTSSLDRIDSAALYYSIHTVGGVSGGPVFSVDEHGNYIAVAIHNYHWRGTRLTCRILLEMLSWIGDYPLQRTVRVPDSDIYLQATSGTRPNIVARPSRASLKFVMVDAPKGLGRGKPHYAILPAGAQPCQKQELQLLALDETNQRVFFEECARPCRRHIIGILEKGKKFRALTLPDSKYSVKVLPSKRARCECGCITQDQKVGLEEGRGTLFLIS